MDSLQRVELLGVIEEEMGVFVDDSALDPEATVGQIAALIDASREAKHEHGVLAWPLHPVTRAVGMTFQELFTAPLLNLFYRIRITGQEHLAGLEGPVLFASNHCLHTDNQIVMSSMPFVWRWRLSVAASASGSGATRSWRWPVACWQTRSPSLAKAGPGAVSSCSAPGSTGEFNILIYPEGELTVGGPMKPFLAGTGLVAVESATAVVPTKLRIGQMAWVDAYWPGGSGRI